jgi:hypothetical protein
MNRSNEIVGSPTCDPEGADATVIAQKLEDNPGLDFYRGRYDAIGPTHRICP